MALKATIFKADVQISDMDRHYYQQHSLTLARHPSETDERMMVRLFAFALFASNDLQFTKGISSDDEPDVWQKDLTGQIELWIDVGIPDEKRLRKASGRSRHVIVVCYGGSAASIWWKKNGDALTQIRNLSVINIDKAQSEALALLADRSIELQFTIQEGSVWLSNNNASIEITPEYWLKPQTEK
jgi:uncharacterized protein YaeQ